MPDSITDKVDPLVSLEDVLTNHHTRIIALEKQVVLLLGIVKSQDAFNSAITDKITGQEEVIAH